MTSRATWKGLERRVAKLFKTYRTPLSGKNSRHTSSDILHKKYFVECKYRKKSPTVKLWHETAHLAKLENKVPILVLKAKNKKGEVAVIDLKLLVKLLKLLKE